MFDVLMVEKVLLMRKNLVAVLIVSTTDAMIAAVDSLIQAVRRVMGYKNSASAEVADLARAV